MTVRTRRPSRGGRRGRLYPGCRRRQEGQAPRHHRVAPRGVVRLVMPAVGPTAVDLQEALEGQRQRCAGGVAVTFIGWRSRRVGAHAAAIIVPASGVPPDLGRTSVDHDAPTLNHPPPVDRRASLPSFRDAQVSSNQRPLRARRPAPSHPSQPGRRSPIERPGRRRDTGASCRPRISDRASGHFRSLTQRGRLRRLRRGASAALPRDVRCYSTNTTKTTITTMTNAAIAMVRVLMTSRLRSIVPARAHWRRRDEDPGHLHHHKRSDH
jgi:hypothetical protein